MQPIPILYGMTAGEYARMLVGERWYPGAAKTQLKIMAFTGHDARTPIALQVPPSPNLRTHNAVMNYAWMCLFEGTVVSVGRGTSAPFEQWGHPAFKGMARDTFFPRSVVGASKPPHGGSICYGENVSGSAASSQATAAREPKANAVDLTALVKAYQWYPNKDKFFNAFFEKLAGQRELRQQIQSGMSAEQIAATWTPKLKEFKSIRKKYLLYPDAE
jgi:uncharacterized protein YbbC (DUF1343 family)